VGGFFSIIVLEGSSKGVIIDFARRAKFIRPVDLRLKNESEIPIPHAFNSCPHRPGQCHLIRMKTAKIGQDGDNLELVVDIGICTFKRPQVADTLRSLSRLTLKPHWHIHVIVADNDECDSARNLVETTARETGLSVSYIHAPARNISVARNACLGSATATFFAFIDDDELVTDNWLLEMLSTAESSGAEIILGPLNAIYQPDAPKWMRHGDFHSARPVWVNNVIITGYTSNVLFRPFAPAIKGLRFRERLGRYGMEDSVFFSEAVKAGCRIAYANTAIVTEIVAPERTKLGWLMRRRLKSGHIHSILLLENSHENFGIRIKDGVIASIKVLFCFGMALFSAYDAERFFRWSLRGTLHIGTLAGLIDKSRYP
jgi:succinoglycan biosynthesis protein ExoM